MTSLKFWTIACLCLTMTLWSDIAQSQDASKIAHEGPILVRDIRILDGLGGAPLEHRDILLQEGRIERVAVANMITELPEDTKIIEGEGLTLLPGLIDMHVHFQGGWNRVDPDYPLKTDPTGVNLSAWNYLYAGVTTIFDLGSDQDWIVSIRDKIAAGEILGPRMFVVGATFNRVDLVSELNELPDKGVESIKANLDRKQELGIDFIKLYTGLSIWEARFIMEEAKKRNMKAVADFWYMNVSRDAAEVSGVDGFAHGSALPISDKQAKWFKDNDRFVIPTLTVFSNLGGYRQYEDIKTRSFEKNPLIVDVLGPQMVKEYYDTFYLYREQMQDGENSFYNRMLFGDMKPLLPITLKNIRTLHEAGVTLAAGTDAPFPQGTWFGESMHYELELFAQAGIANTDIIKIATYNGAKILRREHEFGSIQKGLAADILIVKGNPAENISDTRNIAYVIKEGKLINREALKVGGR